MITAAGVGSGIDVESILTQLDAIERQPVDKLNVKRAALDVELSAYGTVKSALSGFNTAVDTMASDEKFGAFVATSSDEEVFTAVSSGGDIPENLDVEVLALATNHRLSSESYASEEAAVTQGTMKFSSGDNQFEIVIDNGNSTLLALRDAINDSIDNTTVSASIINVDGGSRMILTAKDSGTEGKIDVTRAGANTDAGFTEVTEATDASLIVHGFSVTSSSNTISDVIEGVTLNLTGVGKSTLSTARDTTSLRESVDEFVVKYNSMVSTLNNLSDTELQGDQLPSGVESRIRSAFLDEIDLGNGDSTTAREMGFTFDRYGTLSVDDTSYNSALDDGVSRFVEAFAKSDSGLAARFGDLVDEYTGAGGILSIREDGVATRQSNIDDQIDRLEYRLDKISTRLRAQFTAMDLVVTNLNNTSGYLASQLGNFDY
ncbi:flagellar filament capping protein FliD [Granulosicoccus antarcticus]|uniref:Flagellar hook-associated protein 2 n=1 Tax=Granulosicoccus antarcticus IMCC3135 TaxID=1192854 RepID=A0A2Z2NKG0_9GAMM|nr:flagellar filament capping protein FliD [Granulosicoccus antarcticus]ASJ71796.1 Flagellar hook-associated protein 2 [Granulosicoccus antarcticus IMCC3135]